MGFWTPSMKDHMNPQWPAVGQQYDAGMQSILGRSNVGKRFKAYEADLYKGGGGITRASNAAISQILATIKAGKTQYNPNTMNSPELMANQEAEDTSEVTQNMSAENIKAVEEAKRGMIAGREQGRQNKFQQWLALLQGKLGAQMGASTPYMSGGLGGQLIGSLIAGGAGMMGQALGKGGRWGGTS